MLFSQSFIVSKIPLPKTYVQDLDPYECDEACMQEYLDKDMIFSFLARANKKLDNPQQDEIRVLNISILNLGAGVVTGKVKIAMLLPYKRIGKYASSTTNAAFAYLITKSHSFELKSYKIETENEDDIRVALAQMEQDGFTNIIAPLTHDGAQNIANINPSIHIFFPTIHKNDINTSSPYLLFGAIDYKAQSELLMKEAVSPLVIFSDKSYTGKKLAAFEEDAFKYKILEQNTSQESSFNFFGLTQEEEQVKPEPVRVLIKENKVIKHFISRRTTNLEHYLKEKEEIVNGSFVVNTPIVKSGMIMSQFTLYDVNATNVLSTQINYDPLLLSMTQYIDRKNMIVANSITQQNNILTETNALLGNDIVYDWINYATTVGLDYFYSLLTNEDREYNINLIDNQMVYKTELLKPSYSKFLPYTPIEAENLE
jgi:SRSO17 transposase